MKVHAYNRSNENQILVIVHPELLDEWNELVKNHGFDVVSREELQKLPTSNPPEVGLVFVVRCPIGKKAALESFVLNHT